MIILVPPWGWIASMVLLRTRLDASQKVLLHALKLLLCQRALLVQREYFPQFINAALNRRSATLICPRLLILLFWGEIIGSFCRGSG